MAIVVTRDSTTWVPGGEEPDARSRRNGRLASPGQRRGADAQFAGARRGQARGDDRVPVAGWFPVVPGADLSRPAAGFAEPPADRRAYRSGAAGRHPYRDGRADRLRRALLLPAAEPAVHHELHDAISRIHFGPFADPASVDLRRVALVPFGGDGDHGGDAVAHNGTRRARFRQSRPVDARRGYRPVPPGSRHRSRLAPAGLLYG